MNKNKLVYIIPAVLLVGAIVAMAVMLSGGSKMKNLLKQIPADADVVAVGNLKTILESAGGSFENSEIKLPTFITEALTTADTKKLEKANEMLKKSGVDPEACAIFAYYKKRFPVMVMAVTDQKLFAKAIEDEGFSEKDKDEKVTMYAKKTYEGSTPDYDDYTYIALSGDYAYCMNSVWVGSDVKPAKFLPQVIEDAANDNYADTPYGSYLLEGNAGGVAFTWPKELKQYLRESGLPSGLTDIYNGAVCMRANLKGGRATVDMTLFDDNGKKIDPEVFNEYMDMSATISKDALALLGKDDVMVTAMCMKKVDWDKYTDFIVESARLSRSDRMQLNIMLDYLKKIDGTVAFGCGLTKGLESAEQIERKEDIMQAFSATLVIEAKEGKAKRVIDDMKGLMEKMRMPFEEDATGFTIDLSGMGMGGSVYGKVVDNFIVLANHPVKADKDNVWIKDAGLDDYLSAFGIWLNKDHKLMRDLKLPYDIHFSAYCKPKSAEASAMLEIDGDDDLGVIARMAKLVLSINAKGKEMYEQRYSPEPDLMNDIDSEAVEEVVADSTAADETMDAAA